MARKERGRLLSSGESKALDFPFDGLDVSTDSALLFPRDSDRGDFHLLL